MLSLFNSIDVSIKSFLEQVYKTLGFVGLLAIFIGVELLFVLIFVIKSFMSYEARIRKNLDTLNRWLFKNKKIDENNIVEFNSLIKRGPKRLVYYWQQYILYREGVPSNFLTEENIIEKPLKTSGWKNSIKTLGLLTAIWSAIAVIFGLGSQTGSITLQNMAVGGIIAVAVALIGTITVISLRTKRIFNLDEIYHLYHLFARFLNNACDDLTPFIDFNLLFTAKEIENGNPQLRAYYEARARKAKEEFEQANKQDVQQVGIKFEDIGVNGALLLDRAMKESEEFITKKNATKTQISQVESQKDALRRNYENVQMDLQRKIQTAKENIAKLIEQQAATTSRMEVGLLRQQQEKEVAKQAEYQKDYDQEEKRYNTAKAELDGEIEKLNKVLEEGLEQVTKGMTAEYQTFLEKLMESAYKVAEKRVADEKKQVEKEKEKNEEELTIVQTQIKRLKDENDTLRDRLAAIDPEYKSNIETEEGHYSEEGNFIYADGSFHDEEGLFHNTDGQVYNMNGENVSKDETEEEKEAREAEELKESQINQFGAFLEVDDKDNVNVEIANKVEEEPKQEEKTEEPKKQEQKEEIKEEDSQEEPKKRPGRPKKEVKEEETEQKRKPGRPKKEVTEEQEEPKRKPGRPKKEVKEEETEPKRKPGRPKKETTEKAEPKRKPGRPKKKEDDSLKKINEMINEEEKNYQNINKDVDKEIDKALNSSSENDERDEILKAVEDLKKQAENARKNGVTEGEELAKINKRIEELINKLSQIND